MYKFGRIPLAISVCAIFFRPPLFSTRTASSLKKTIKNICTFQKKKIIKNTQFFYFNEYFSFQLHVNFDTYVYFTVL